MPKISVTHVGSLPRSQDVVDFIFARENNEPYDQELFDRCMSSAVSDTVAKQVAAGVDIVSDGETSKISYATYVKDSYILLESSNPRHAHEWMVFRDRSKEIPEDKILVPGLVDTTTNFVEHPLLIAQRLSNFINIVGRERVVAGSDCGFGTFAGFGSIDPDIAYAKLAALSEGAALAGSIQ